MTFTVYGGNGHRKLKDGFSTRAEAAAFATAFEIRCWGAGVVVPRSIISEEDDGES